MKDYGLIEPTFFTRGSGKLLRGHPEAQIVACWLFANAPMCGIWHVVLPTIATETGLSADSVVKGLSRLAMPEIDIAHYDAEEEIAYLVTGVLRATADTLAVNDKRIGAIRKQAITAGRHPFVADFFQRYGNSHHLGGCPFEGVAADQEAPSKPVAVTVAVAVAVAVDQNTHTAGESGREPMNSEARSILETLRAHPSLEPVATVRFAEILSGRLTGKALPWVVTAIGEAAADIPEGMSAEKIQQKVRVYFDRARAPGAQRADKAQPFKQPPSAAQQGWLAQQIGDPK